MIATLPCATGGYDAPRSRRSIADSDLRAPIAKVQQLFPDKRIVVAFPPNRHSAELGRVADAYLMIGRASLARSLFPPEVIKPDGYVLRCPPSWQ